MKIYVACGLTHVPRGAIFDEHVAFIHTLAATLKGAGHEVMYALVNSDPTCDQAIRGSGPALLPMGPKYG